MNGYILFGVHTGEQSWDGKGWHSDTEIAVAIFENFDEAEQYIADNRLKNPNYSKHEIFFKNSLLAGFDRAFVYQKEIPMFRAPRKADPDNDPWLIQGNDGAIFERERFVDWSGGWGR